MEIVPPTESEIQDIGRICEEIQLFPEGIISDLREYAKELIRWQKIKNLVSRETLPEIWSRHFLDSLQLTQQINPSGGIVLDYGSGGGLPAIPIAIAFKTTKLQVHMIESNARKCAFLRHISRQLGLNCVVHNLRAENLILDPGVQVGTITARGFADLGSTFTYCFPHFGPNTIALLQKRPWI